MSLGSFFGRVGDILVEGIEQVAIPIASQVAVSRIQEKQLKARARRAQPASFPPIGGVTAGLGIDFERAGFIDFNIGEGGISLGIGPGEGGGGLPMAGLPSAGAAGGLWKPVRSSATGAIIGARARSIVSAVNPLSGTTTFFRHVGQPVLFSGDARICKSVRKKARKALSASGG